MNDIPIGIDLEKIIQRLKSREIEINQLRLSSSEARDVVELDQTRVGRLSRMDALQSQAMSLESERRRQAELERITATLARLESGQFGYCLKCDEEIQLKRLELDPTTTLCVACASTAPKGQ
ncbi:TraR/DksA family transcriptional regulator [Kiloniella laminariae]|uniref:TraR/DksA family transcriptional regulator n=1 Tax=Kiloniella laminariae TaxID=454162 RepID=UPI00036F7703|nr:TraR/DksA C4-type zinc finger protein [Kiloniella laminariae]